MLYSAYVYGRSAAVRYPRGEGIGVPVEAEFREIPFGKWELLKDGSDISLLACGPLVYTALLAAQELEAEGISCAVVNARFIKPMDREMIINFASHTKKLLTIEENAVIGGFGSGVMEVLSDEGLVVPVKRLGLPDRFMTHASQKLLRQQVGLDKDGIRKTVKRWLNPE
jgi:1-deoxy-D-xylulose-5-phosphate synthase